MSSFHKMSQIKAFLSFLWNLAILCNFCLTVEEKSKLIDLRTSGGSVRANGGYFVAVLLALPQKPENISCFYHYKHILNCSWISGREIPNDTNCTISTNGKDKPGKMKDGSCIVQQVLFVDYITQVKVPLFGEEGFNVTPQYKKYIVKPGPPQIMKVEGMKEMLRVHLRKKPEEPDYDPFMCQIQYQATAKNISANISIPIEHYVRNQIANLTGLWNFTNYTVAVRCRLREPHESSPWSEWSNKVTGRTEEQAPSKLDLWRVIETIHPNERRVHLLWKVNKGFPSSGIITGYTVRYIAENSNITFEKKYNQKELVILSLTEDAYNISFSAHNSAGESPEAIIRVPSSKHEKTMKPKIVHLKASALKEKMNLTWDLTDSEIDGYLIEWYESEENTYKRSWHRIRNTTKWTSPKGILKKFKCYNFSVYPLCKDEIKKPTSISIYFHENVPSSGPDPELENVGKDYATIKWKEIPKSKRNGVIINYTIIYETDNKLLEETVDGSILKYKLKSLQPLTNYKVWIKANTTIGGTTGSQLSFFTVLLSTTDIILAAIFIGIFMTCLLSFGLLWALKYKMIKRICWPQIPHPVIASCPAVSQKFLLGNSSSEDDINILKIDTCNENKLPLLNPENCFKQANVTAEIKVAGQGTFCSGEYKALEFFLSVSSLNHDFKNQTFLTTRRHSESSAKEEMQYQENLQEKTEFNSYLKNSIQESSWIARM